MRQRSRLCSPIYRVQSFSNRRASFHMLGVFHRLEDRQLPTPPPPHRLDLLRSAAFGPIDDVRSRSRKLHVQDDESHIVAPERVCDFCPHACRSAGGVRRHCSRAVPKRPFLCSSGRCLADRNAERHSDQGARRNVGRLGLLRETSANIGSSGRPSARRCCWGFPDLRGGSAASSEVVGSSDGGESENGSRCGNPSLRRACSVSEIQGERTTIGDRRRAPRSLLPIRRQHRWIDRRELSTSVVCWVGKEVRRERVLFGGSATDHPQPRRGRRHVGRGGLREVAIEGAASIVDSLVLRSVLRAGSWPTAWPGHPSGGLRRRNARPGAPTGTGRCGSTASRRSGR